MNKAYKKIMALPDAYELKETVRKWHTVSLNLKKQSTILPGFLPNLLLSVKNGISVTRVVSLLCDYLAEEQNLIEFCGNVRFLEFIPEYVPSGQPFGELRRLMTEVADAAGHRNFFAGVLCLDISEWARRAEEKHFQTLLEYLNSLEDRVLIVFSVSDATPKELRKLESVLSMYVSLETVSIALPEAVELSEVLCTALEKYGLSLSADAKELITETIDVLRKNRYFDEFRTLEHLARDIACTAYSAPVFHNVLTTNDLHDFVKSGIYVQKRTPIHETKQHIGFAS